jgi:hypothetical protein
MTRAERPPPLEPVAIGTAPGEAPDKEVEAACMHVPLSLLIAAGCALVVLLVILRLRKPGRRDLLHPPRAPHPLRLPRDVERKVRDLLAEGRKSDAVSEVRASARVDLKTARREVARMSRHVLRKVGQHQPPEIGWSDTVGGQDGVRYERAHGFNPELREQDARGTRGEFFNHGG